MRPATHIQDRHPIQPNRRLLLRALLRIQHRDLRLQRAHLVHGGGQLAAGSLERLAGSVRTRLGSLPRAGLPVAPPLEHPDQRPESVHLSGCGFRRGSPATVGERTLQRLDPAVPARHGVMQSPLLVLQLLPVLRILGLQRCQPADVRPVRRPDQVGQHVDLADASRTSSGVVAGCVSTAQ